MVLLRARRERPNRPVAAEIGLLLAALMLSPLPDTLSTMMSVLVSLLASIRSSVRSRVVLQRKVLALRHQLHVLDRSLRGFASRASTACCGSCCHGFGMTGDRHVWSSRLTRSSAGIAEDSDCCGRGRADDCVAKPTPLFRGRLRCAVIASCLFMANSEFLSNS
jgi:hypothetical protein